MATKTVELDGIGTVYLYKRRSSRHIRLSVTGAGKVRVTMPTWVPFSAGLAFAKQKTDWLQSQAKPAIVLRQGAAIGKRHRLLFLQKSGQKTVTTRITNDGVISIKLPGGMLSEDDKAQAAAIKACIRALKREAEEQLPGRLRQLATEHGFNFRSVEVKQLKSRWGSCNHRQEIILNCFLMQLPWHLIDYVLLHELVHTRIMQHGPKFWAEMDKHVPRLAEVRKQMRLHRPNVIDVA
jgi:predicted metal-dependent hydrolase